MTAALRLLRRLPGAITRDLLANILDPAARWAREVHYPIDGDDQ